MDTIVTARPPQTLYVTIHRDELRQLKEERDRLKQEVAQLRLLTLGTLGTQTQMRVITTERARQA